MSSTVGMECRDCFRGVHGIVMTKSDTLEPSLIVVVLMNSLFDAVEVDDAMRGAMNILVDHDVWFVFMGGIHSFVPPGDMLMTMISPPPQWENLLSTFRSVRKTVVSYRFEAKDLRFLHDIVKTGEFGEVSSFVMSGGDLSFEADRIHLNTSCYDVYNMKSTFDAGEYRWEPTRWFFLDSALRASKISTLRDSGYIPRFKDILVLDEGVSLISEAILLGMRLHDLRAYGPDEPKQLEEYFDGGDRAGDVARRCELAVAHA